MAQKPIAMLSSRIGPQIINSYSNKNKKTDSRYKWKARKSNSQVSTSPFDYWKDISLVS